MIFLNNTPSGRVSNRYGRRIAQFGSISNSSQPNRRHTLAEESDNFLLGCIVGSFGIAITLALVLLPLSICCTALIYHPFFVFGVVLFGVLTLLGAILCICHPIMRRCWWYKDEGICSTSPASAHRRPSNDEYSPYVVDGEYLSTNVPLGHGDTFTKSQVATRGNLIEGSSVDSHCIYAATEAAVIELGTEPAEEDSRKQVKKASSPLTTIQSTVTIESETF